ncbi:MAG: hypothetical protein ACC656_07880, partial [Candidatus Heimdallarchaeota archaeon]
MGSTKVKQIYGQNQTIMNLNNQETVIESNTIRNFHGLSELPLCCDLPSDSVISKKISQFPTELQAELSELMEYGFQPYAMKDWITKDILSEITGLDPNSLRDEKFRKSKFDFRDPSSWGEFLKGNRKFYRVWEQGRYAELHELFFSAFLNRVLSEAEQYLHPSFTRDHPKIKDYKREVIDFLDNKFDPEKNHGRFVADASALTEIYATTMTAKLQSIMLHLTHNIRLEETREIVKNSTTLITKKGSLGNSFDYLMTVDREKLGCQIEKSDSRFLIVYGEVKGVSERYSELKGSTGTYQEIIVGSLNRN